MIASLPQKVPLVMEEVTDPVAVAQGRAQRERFDRNWNWLKANAPSIYDAHRGKIICIAGQEVFAADTTEEVLALAHAAHPDDDGQFTMIIPREKAYRIYADQRSMVRLR